MAINPMDILIKLLLKRDINVVIPIFETTIPLEFGVVNIKAESVKISLSDACPKEGKICGNCGD